MKVAHGALRAGDAEKVGGADLNGRGHRPSHSDRSTRSDPDSRAEPEGPTEGEDRRDRSGPVDRADGADRTAGAHQAQQAFWLAHMRIGFGIFIGEALFALAYLGLTPNGPHRPVLWAMVGVWLAAGTASVFIAKKVAEKPWRGGFSSGWTILSAVAVAGLALLDHGINSPLEYLLFLPIAFAALAFTPKTAAVCGASCIASAMLVTFTDHDVSVSVDGALMFFAALLGAAVLSTVSAVNRANREHHERLQSEEIARLASTDGLTGCAVRRVFHERLTQEVARSVRHGHPISLAMLDVDDFKGVNDSYGHLVGDNVLAAVGSALLENCRSFDTVGRLGGDEFAVLMPDTEPESAVALVERIRALLPPMLEVEVTLSVGISGIDRSAPTPEQMLDDADFALYEVKRNGRDGVAVRNPEATARSPELRLRNS